MSTLTLLPDGALTNRELNRSDLIILNAMGSFVNNYSGECVVRLKKIMEKTELSRSTTIRSIKKLCSFNYLQKESREKEEDGATLCNKYKMTPLKKKVKKDDAEMYCKNTPENSRLEKNDVNLYCKDQTDTPPPPPDTGGVSHAGTPNNSLEQLKEKKNIISNIFKRQNKKYSILEYDEEKLEMIKSTDISQEWLEKNKIGRCVEMELENFKYHCKAFHKAAKDYLSYFKYWLRKAQQLYGDFSRADATELPF